VIVTASILGLGILVGSALALRLAPRRSKGGDSTSGVASRFRVFGEAFATAGREPQAVRWGTAGIASAILFVAMNSLLADSLGISLPVAVLPAIVLLALFTTVVPLSINGLGPREAAYVWCLGTYGVGHDRALAFALLVLAVTLAPSAMGGIVYAVAGGQVRAGR
jgi:hypothetical protein